MEYRVRFTIPTNFIGVDFEEDFEFEFEDDMDEDEIRDEIQSEFEFWVDDQLNDLRAWSEWEFL